jgi:hypothetical protein
MRRTAKTVLLGSLIVLCSCSAEGAALLVPSGTWAPTTNRRARANSSAAFRTADPDHWRRRRKRPARNGRVFNTDGTASTAVPMNVARATHFHGAARRSVLVAAGLWPVGSANGADYDPVANSWTNLSGGMVGAFGATPASVAGSTRLHRWRRNAGVVSVTTKFLIRSKHVQFAGALSSPRTQHAWQCSPGRVIIIGVNGMIRRSSDIFDPLRELCARANRTSRVRTFRNHAAERPGSGGRRNQDGTTPTAAPAGSSFRRGV